MLKYEAFTKMESVVCEFHSQLELFDESIITGVRGLGKGENGSRVITPYKGCEYLGELAERCEERNIATDKRSLRSILMAFIMETNKNSNEDFLYNQFEMFEKIYKNKLGKDYSILDEILIKKCKSQISEDVSDFDIDYEIFNKEAFLESTEEEQILTILALTAYRDYAFADISRLRPYAELTQSVLKLVSTKLNHLNNLLTYVSLSHVYDVITSLVKKGIFGKFSKGEKDFYKCIKDIAVTDMNTDFYGPEVYETQRITISTFMFELEDVVRLSTDSMGYSSTNLMIKKDMTLPSKCRKWAIQFNYNLSKGIVDKKSLYKIQGLYKANKKNIYTYHMFDYFNISSIKDALLYCDVLDELRGVYGFRTLVDACEEHHHESNIVEIKSKLSNLIVKLYEDGDKDSIYKYCKKYRLFDKVVDEVSVETPQGYMLSRDLYESRGHKFYLNGVHVSMLFNHNCIDDDFIIKIDDYAHKLSIEECETVIEVAWSLGKYAFAAKLARTHSSCMEVLMSKLLEKDNYIYISNRFKSHWQVLEILDSFKDSPDEAIVVDLILEMIIRTSNIELYKDVLKERLNKIFDLYNFNEEDKNSLIKGLISENVNIESKVIYLNNFIVDAVGIENCFKILNIDKDTAFEIKINYIKSHENSYREREREYVEILKETLHDDQLINIEINKHREYLVEMVDAYSIGSREFINYLDKHKDVIFKYCIKDIKRFINERLSKKKSYCPSQMSSLYIYLKSHDIDYLEDTLSRLNEEILEVFLSN